MGVPHSPCRSGIEGAASGSPIASSLGPGPGTATGRRPSLVTSSQQSRALLGSSLETAELELVAGMCYRHITDLNEYKNLLSAYAGQTDKSPGLHPVPGAEEYLPQGLFNSKFEEDEGGLGCIHPISLEWVFNAKRPEALRAGLTHIADGEEMDVDPSQIDPASYFDLSAEGFCIRILGRNSQGGP